MHGRPRRCRARTAGCWNFRRRPWQPSEAKSLSKAYAALRNVGTKTDLANCETELGRAGLVLGDGHAGRSCAETAYRRYRGEVRLETAAAELARAGAVMAVRNTSEGHQALPRRGGDVGPEVANAAPAVWRELAGVGGCVRGLSMFEAVLSRTSMRSPKRGPVLPRCYPRSQGLYGKTRGRAQRSQPQPRPENLCQRCKWQLR